MYRKPRVSDREITQPFEGNRQVVVVIPISIAINGTSAAIALRVKPLQGRGRVGIVLAPFNE